MDHTTRPPLVHRGAPKIAQRAGEILNERFPSERIYQWRIAGKLPSAFYIGPNIAITDDGLIADLTGKTQDAA